MHHVPGGARAVGLRMYALSASAPAGLSWSGAQCQLIAPVEESSVSHSAAGPRATTPGFRAVRIDTACHFSATVGACFFVAETTRGSAPDDCPVFPSLHTDAPVTTTGWCRGFDLSDARTLDRADLFGTDGNHAWRSGIKHDCRRALIWRWGKQNWSAMETRLPTWNKPTCIRC